MLNICVDNTAAMNKLPANYNLIWLAMLQCTCTSVSHTHNNIVWTKAPWTKNQSIAVIRFNTCVHKWMPGNVFEWCFNSDEYDDVAWTWFCSFLASPLVRGFLIFLETTAMSTSGCWPDSSSGASVLILQFSLVSVLGNSGNKIEIGATIALVSQLLCQCCINAY